MIADNADTAPKDISGFLSQRREELGLANTSLPPVGCLATGDPSPEEKHVLPAGDRLIKISLALGCELSFEEEGSTRN